MCPRVGAHGKKAKTKVANPREVVGWLQVSIFGEWLASAYVLMCVDMCAIPVKV